MHVIIQHPGDAKFYSSFCRSKGSCVGLNLFNREADGLFPLDDTALLQVY